MARQIKLGQRENSDNGAITNSTSIGFATKDGERGIVIFDAKLQRYVDAKLMGDNTLHTGTEYHKSKQEWYDHVCSPSYKGYIVAVHSFQYPEDIYHWLGDE